MEATKIEQRLAALESRVNELQEALRAAQQPGKDWRRTIGVFTGDEGLQEIMRQAMRLREADRKQARRKKPADASRHDSGRFRSKRRPTQPL